MHFTKRLREGVRGGDITCSVRRAGDAMCEPVEVDAEPDRQNGE